MAVKVDIEGGQDSSATYDDEAYLAADNKAYEALVSFYESGATIANTAELVERALNDVGAAV